MLADPWSIPYDPSIQPITCRRKKQVSKGTCGYPSAMADHLEKHLLYDFAKRNKVLAAAKQFEEKLACAPAKQLEKAKQASELALEKVCIAEQKASEKASIVIEKAAKKSRISDKKAAEKTKIEEEKAANIAAMIDGDPEGW
ncbi:hypothetical protein VP01_1118g4 [Puccinia sorghi]|uniref:Uncharacterized protein n=1 Tax=Puccinia sorghi TaxID=27349 RepID=A0A0L6VSH4_9BASI|nr:hypothetical protein VP01_1118g4 [Puccinia sorghi]